MLRRHAASCCSLLALLALSPVAKVSAQTSDNLTISVQSVSSTYFIGTRLTVVAYSNHPELRIVGWERGPASDQVVSSEAYAIFTAPDGSNSRLRIASPVASDAGTYTVVARDGQNREIRKESEEIELLYPVIINADPRQYILEGSTGFLNCSTPNTSTTLHWQFKGQPISPSDSSITHLSDDRLQISNMMERHEGLYTCEVFSVQYLMPWSKTITLERAAPVRVTAPPTDVDVLEGERVELVIGYHGNPKPVVTWYYNNIELDAPATQDVGPVALMGTHSLVFDVVMETDGGTYKAELVNGYGSDMVTVTVNVSVPAQITLLPNISVVGGTLVIMTCEARGTPPISFAWTYNGAAWTGTVDDSHTHSSSITVGGASASTMGVYCCTATNDFGSSQKDAVLTIIRKPSKPVGLMAYSSTETSFTVSWSYPASASQPVERFNVVVRSDTSGEVKRFEHMLDSMHFDRVSTSYEVADLIPGTMYSVEISAVNKAGEGESSEQHTFWTDAAPPSVSAVSAVGLNHSAIRITVTLEYRGSVQPISFQVNYEGAVAGATTSGSRLFNDVQLDGLTWSGVVSGLTEFEAYVLTVTPMSSEGQGRSLKTTPTYPKPVPSAAPSLTLLSSTEDSLHISATLAHLGLPAVTAVELNVTSPVVLTQRVDISEGDALPVTVTFTLRKLQFGTVYSVLAYGVGDGGPGAVTQRDFMTALSPAVISGIIIGGLVLLFLVVIVIILVVYCVRKCRKKYNSQRHYFHHRPTVEYESSTEMNRFAESPGRLRRTEVAPRAVDTHPKQFPHAQSFSGQPWDIHNKIRYGIPVSNSDTALLGRMDNMSVSATTNTQWEGKLPLFSQPKPNASPVPSDHSHSSTGRYSTTGGVGNHLEYRSAGSGSRHGSGSYVSVGGNHIGPGNHLGMGGGHQGPSSHHGSDSHLSGMGVNHVGSGNHLGMGAHHGPSNHHGSGSHHGSGNHHGSDSHLSGMGVGHVRFGNHLGLGGSPVRSASHAGMGGGHVGTGSHLGVGGNHVRSGSHGGGGPIYFGVGDGLNCGGSVGVLGSGSGTRVELLRKEAKGWKYNYNYDEGPSTPESIRAIPVGNCSTYV